MRALRTAVLALAAALLVAGCSGDPEPRIGTAPSPSAATPSSSPPASVVVADETPEKFIERWLRSSVEMQNSGVVDSYKAMTRGCQPCNKLVRTVESYYESGGYVRFAGQRLVSSEVVPSVPNTTVVRAVVNAQPTEFKASADVPSETFPGGTDTLEVVLIETVADEWLVSDYVEIAP